VGLLADGLVRRGHDVTVYATGDSRTRARLRYKLERAARDHHSLDALLHTVQAFDDAEEFDVIHNHLMQGIPFADFCSIPCITSVDAPLSDPKLVRFLQHYHYPNYVALSQRQIQLLPGLNWIGVVYNGISVEEWPFDAQKQDYVVWMGRLRSEKGAHLAIQAAFKARRRLLLIGPKESGHLEYFQTKIAPYLDGETVIYLGEMGEERKAVVQSARALLFPITWEESFGLVMLEALACGTPVIAFDVAAAPEVVKHGETGFVVSDVEEMAEAVSNVGIIDPSDCRDHVQASFSVDAMVEGFMKIYERLRHAS
jgi:glycosyltransferase involved in cell wall biosynthesis